MLVRLAQIVDRPAGVEHSGVVLSTAVETDVGQRALGHLLGEVHRNLTGLNDFALPGLGLQELNRQVEVIAHHLLDVVNADLAGGVLDKLVDHLLRQLQRHRFPVQAALSDETNEGTLQLTDVRVDRIGQVLHDLARELDAVGVHLLLENRHPGLEARHLHIGTEAPLESGEETLLHTLHLHRRLVAGQDNLLARLMEVIKDVKEHVLRLLLTTEELNIVHDEDVHQLIEVGEVVDAVVPHRVDKLVRELFRVDVEDRLLREAVLDFNSDRVSQVSLAQSHRAVNEERIERGATRFLCHGKTSTARKAVALSFDEVLEAVLGIEVRIDVQLFQTGNHKRILNRRLSTVHGHLNRAVPNCGTVRGRKLYRVWRRACCRLLHDD